MEPRETVLARFLGDYPLIKILDFFLTYREFDYSKTQVAKETGLSRVTVEKIWRDRVKDRIITKTRKIGRATLYKINLDHPLVKLLIFFDLQLIDIYSQLDELPPSGSVKNIPVDLPLPILAHRE